MFNKDNKRMPKNHITINMLSILLPFLHCVFCLEGLSLKSLISKILPIHLILTKVIIFSYKAFPHCSLKLIFLFPVFLLFLFISLPVHSSRSVCFIHSFQCLYLSSPYSVSYFWPSSSILIP